jgi:hypothetical protein
MMVDGTDFYKLRLDFEAYNPRLKSGVTTTNIKSWYTKTFAIVDGELVRQND